MPGNRLPDTGPHDEIERLLALAGHHAEGGYIDDPERLSGDLAAALRAQTAAHSSLLYDHNYLRGYVKELEKERDLLRGQRDRAEKKLAMYERHESQARERLSGVVPVGESDPPTPIPLADFKPVAEARAAAPHDRQSVRDAIETALTVTTGVEKLSLADSVRLIVEEEGADALLDTVIDAVAGAAAPQPLATATTAKVEPPYVESGGSFIDVGLDVPPGTEVAVVRAGQTPGVTREQVAEAVAKALGERFTPGERNLLADYEVATDAVWALLRGEGGDE